MSNQNNKNVKCQIMLSIWTIDARIIFQEKRTHTNIDNYRFLGALVQIWLASIYH